MTLPCAGHYCPAGTVYPDQYPCPAGTYTDETNLTSDSDCTTCPTGSVCLEGSTSVTIRACTAGYYCVAGSSTGTANPCPPGTWSNKTNLADDTECSTCPAGACMHNAREFSTLSRRILLQRRRGFRLRRMYCRLCVPTRQLVDDRHGMSSRTVLEWHRPVLHGPVRRVLPESPAHSSHTLLCRCVRPVPTVRKRRPRRRRVQPGASRRETARSPRDQLHARRTHRLVLIRPRIA